MVGYLKCVFVCACMDVCVQKAMIVYTKPVDLDTLKGLCAVMKPHNILSNL